jgi:Tol biopolymer transport system component/DNA-binding winged helix-turn-helix (wHTH) protein
VAEAAAARHEVDALDDDQRAVESLMPGSTTPAARHPSYVFGPFRFEPGEHLLLRDAQPIALPPKAFELLQTLVARAGHLITKEELLKQVWPDTFVEEANLSYTVSLLRKALGDDQSPHRYIETVPRRGYRFIGQIRDLTAPETSSRIENAIEPAQPKASVWFRPRTAAAIAAMLLTAAAAWLIEVSRESNVRQVPPRLVPLTTMAGFETEPSLSPDGEQVAFTWDGEKRDNADIYVKFIDSAEVRRLTTDPGADVRAAWSPDGRQIAFVHYSPTDATIHVISALGGADRKVADFPVATGGISWSPDGRYIAALRDTGLAIPRQQNTGIYILPLQGGEPRQLTRPKPPGIDEYPTFSADGRHLAYVSCLRWDGSCDVYVLDLTAAMIAAGPPRQLTRQAIWDIWGLAWSRDQRSLIYDAHVSTLSNLWRVDVEGRLPPERIEVAGLHATQPATVASRDRLVFSEFQNDYDIFRLDPGHAPQPVLASTLSEGGAQFSHDGQHIVFASTRSGTAVEIWVADADGSDAHQLTHGPGPWQASPDWSPDDRKIAFDAMAPDGRWHIWTIAADGASPRQITTEPGEQNVPTWSSDGRWIYFSVDQGAGRQIWRVPAGGGNVQQITHDGSGYFARESSDGGSLLYQAGFAKLPLLKVPITGGPARQIASCVQPGSIVERPEGTYYVGCGDDPAVNIVDRMGRTRVLGKMEKFSCDASASLGVSPGGRQFLFARRVKSGADLMVIENFR